MWLIYFMGWCTTCTDFSGWAPMDLAGMGSGWWWAHVQAFRTKEECCHTSCRVLGLEVDKMFVKTEIEMICLKYPFA